MIGMDKKTAQTRVHAFKEPIPCRGIACNVEFQPIRRDQDFCSPYCRVKYFSMARGLGSILLERARREKRYQNIVNAFLFQIQAHEERER